MIYWETTTPQWRMIWKLLPLWAHIGFSQQDASCACGIHCVESGLVVSKQLQKDFDGTVN